MDDDEILVIDADVSVDDDGPGCAPYVQYCAWGDEAVRAEVSSNVYLAGDVMLDHAGEAALARLGWRAPTHAGDEDAGSGSANFHLDAGRREGDRVAAMAVAALRDVFGVPHPAFLDWPQTEEEPQSAATPDGSDEPLAVMPESADHLRELVVSALTPPGGPAVEVDEDGDIPLPMGSALLFVRAVDSAPVVEMFAFVVRGIRHTDRAAFEVAVLNRDTRMIKFVLLDDAVLATLQLPASPFTPRNLRAMVLSMAEVIDRVDDDLVARVGGRRGLEPEPADETDDAMGDEREVSENPADAEDQPGHAQPQDDPEQPCLHPALQTLLHLDAHGTGEVAPELAASVCEFDRDLVLTLLREASEQEITWRKSANLALIGDDTDEAKICFHEAAGWEATVETLRAALQVIVERERAAQPGRGRSSEPRRRRRGRGIRQESLIDEATIRRDTTGQDVLFDRESDEGKDAS
jgi:hypothetical protein